MALDWETQAEFRAAQNYATKMVALQPAGLVGEVGTMGATIKLFPFGAVPEAEPPVPSGHPAKVSPFYYLQGDEA